MGPPMALSIFLAANPCFNMASVLVWVGGDFFTLDKGMLTIILGGDFRGVYLILGPFLGVVLVLGPFLGVYLILGPFCGDFFWKGNLIMSFGRFWGGFFLRGVFWGRAVSFKATIQGGNFLSLGALGRTITLFNRRFLGLRFGLFSFHFNK